MKAPRIVANDTVIVISGSDRGKKGKVIQVIPDERLIVIEGINKRIKNIRAQRSGEKGQKVEYFAPIHLSNVMLADPKSGNPTRIRIRISDREGKKTKERIAAKSGEPVARPTTKKA